MLKNQCFRSSVLKIISFRKFYAFRDRTFLGRILLIYHILNYEHAIPNLFFHSSAQHGTKTGTTVSFGKMHTKYAGPTDSRWLEMASVMKANIKKDLVFSGKQTF